MDRVQVTEPVLGCSLGGWEITLVFGRGPRNPPPSTAASTAVHGKCAIDPDLGPGARRPLAGPCGARRGSAGARRGHAVLLISPRSGADARWPLPWWRANGRPRHRSWRVGRSSGRLIGPGAAMTSVAEDAAPLIEALVGREHGGGAPSRRLMSWKKRTGSEAMRCSR